MMYKHSQKRSRRNHAFLFKITELPALDEDYLSWNGSTPLAEGIFATLILSWIIVPVIKKINQHFSLR